MFFPGVVKLRSRIYLGTIKHHRVGPVEHRFAYPAFYCGFDLDELDKLDTDISFFAHNKFALTSIHDKDYLPGCTGSIRQRLTSFLESAGRGTDLSRVELITCPRYLSRVFNPVSFYRCYKRDDSLDVVVVEVNNTFGETHAYILDERQNGCSPRFAHYSESKEFHVSPFLERRGQYEFYFGKSEEQLDIRINLQQDGKPVFLSQLQGEAVPLTNKTLMKAILQYPLSGLMSLPRIMWQAAKLKFQKSLPVYTRPIASSPMTLKREGPSWFQLVGERVLKRVLSQLKRGKLVLEFPDKPSYFFGKEKESKPARVSIKNYDFFWRSVLGGDIGFGEAYVDNYWDSEDLTGVIRFFVENQDYFDDRSILLAKFNRLANRLFHLRRTNTKKNSKGNIYAHYDLGNDFFKLFLDQSMTYSGALFESPAQSLEEAQENKIRALLKPLQLAEGEHLLEIGSGWGALAIRAAQKYSCRVTSITLSEQQLEFARERVKQAGLEGQVEIRLCDYRDLKGQYDKIVSVEMLEAVGHRYLGQFFKICDSLLEPNGIVSLQVITIPDQKYEAYRKSCDWIQKYIFPGGLCPSIEAMGKAMSENSRFVMEEIRNIGPHYAQTIAEWRKRFRGNLSEISDLGLDRRFIRMWEYYFAYCEAAFAARALGTHQIVLTRPLNQSLAVW